MTTESQNKAAKNLLATRNHESREEWGCRGGRRAWKTLARRAPRRLSKTLWHGHA